MNEMLSTYIYWNVLYSNGLGVFNSLHAKIADMIYYSCEAIITNLEWSALLIIGFCWAMFRTKQHWKESLVILMGVIVQWFALYLPSRYFGYYVLVLAPFAVFGFIALLDCEIRLFEKRKMPQRSVKRLVMATSFALSCTLIALNIPGFVRQIHDSHEKDAQTEFAEIMNSRENPTLLVYGSLDRGFYYRADISPTCKYFCRTNQPNPEMIEMQNDFVENGRTDFVVTSGQPLDAYDVDCSKYAYVCDRDNHYLYELIDNKM